MENYGGQKIVYVVDRNVSELVFRKSKKEIEWTLRRLYLGDY